LFLPLPDLENHPFKSPIRVILTFAWIIRVVITMVHPWNYDFMELIQLDCFVIVFIILLIPLLCIALEIAKPV